MEYLLLMAGQQHRLIRIQAIMAGVMVVLSLQLIPKLGLTGAALAAALTNAISTVWYLREVWCKLRMFRYNRSYLGLPLPVGGSLGALLRVPSVAGGSLPSFSFAGAGGWFG